MTGRRCQTHLVSDRLIAGCELPLYLRIERSFSLPDPSISERIRMNMDTLDLDLLLRPILLVHLDLAHLRQRS